MRPILINAFMVVASALAGCGQSGPLRAAPGAVAPSPATAAPAPAPLPPGAQTPATEAPLNTDRDAPRR